MGGIEVLLSAFFFLLLFDDAKFVVCFWHRERWRQQNQKNARTTKVWLWSDGKTSCQGTTSKATATSIWPQEV